MYCCWFSWRGELVTGNREWLICSETYSKTERNRLIDVLAFISFPLYN